MRSQRADQEFVTHAELATIVFDARTRTEQAARLASGIVNGVLSTELFTIGTQGRVTREFGSAFGSIMVTHHGPSLNPLLVQAASPIGETRPSNGRAMGQINAGCAGTLALTGHEVTVWGTVGDQVTLEVFTSCVPPTKTVQR